MRHLHLKFELTRTSSQRHLLEGWGRELSPDLVSEQPQVETNDVQQHVELAESIASAIAMLHD